MAERPLKVVSIRFGTATPGSLQLVVTPRWPSRGNPYQAIRPTTTGQSVDLFL